MSKKSRKRLRKKPQMKLRQKREPRTVIISFRVRRSEFKQLKQMLKEHPVAGIKSVKQFARKLTIDHAMGRTVYNDAEATKVSPDVAELMPAR